jgi:hypothetical protein
MSAGLLAVLDQVSPVFGSNVGYGDVEAARSNAAALLSALAPRVARSSDQAFVAAATGEPLVWCRVSMENPCWSPGQLIRFPLRRHDWEPDCRDETACPDCELRAALTACEGLQA